MKERQLRGEKKKEEKENGGEGTLHKGKRVGPVRFKWSDSISLIQ